MDDFELEIKKEFINEALMNLEETEGSFMELETSADPKPLLDKIFRLAHNLKGGSRAVGFADVAEFTHRLENLVLKIQQGAVALSSGVVTTLLVANDTLAGMLVATKADLSATFDNAAILAQMQACIDGQTPAAESVAPKAAPAAEAPSPSPAEPLVAEEAEAPAEMPPPAADLFQEEPVAVVAAPTSAPIPEAVVAPAPSSAPATKAAPAPAGKEDEIVRVSLSRIEQLNNFVGELIVAQSVVLQQSQELMDRRVHASIRQLSKISKEIQSLSMSLRMLPVKPLVQKLQRVVRDTAVALGKDVQLNVSGEGLDIDKSVLDRLADPLIHILRNAVDHGLEDTEGRRQAGKATKGQVTLSFVNEGNNLVVEVQDDGKGINADVVRRKAIEKNLISASQSLTDKQVINLIFHPGFSTKAVTSEISGRGVGMDVVKTNVEKIGGHVDVSTEVGRGSLFRMKIPLSLAVIDGWVVRTPKGRYVVPVSQILETVSLKGCRISSGQAGIGTCFELRGAVVPLFELENVLGAKGGAIEPEHTALIVSVEGQTVGIVVSEIINSQQIVVKPIEFGITTQKGWIGSCVLGDGLPTLILSPSDLLEGRVSLSRDISAGRAAA